MSALIWGEELEIDMFSVATGRLLPETYDLERLLEQRFARKLCFYDPQAAP
jgi:hypothetical protein